MNQRKWLYKPGEAGGDKEWETSKLEKFLMLTEEYSNLFPDRRVLVLNDNKDIVFFAQLGEDMKATTRVDVFLWNGLQYLAASRETSIELSRKYFDYLDEVALAYDHLEGERKE